MLKLPTNRIGGAWPYGGLMRPPGLATSAADVLAGFAVAGLAAWGALPWLVLSAVALHAGGMVLHDAFDAVEQPDVPTADGRARRGPAAAWGAGLLGLGVGAAWLVGPLAGALALAIAALAVFYDGAAGRLPLAGAGSLGLCRGLTVLLGASAAPLALADHWYVALIPLAYIGAVTTVSRGDGRARGLVGLGLMGLALLGVVGLGVGPGGSLFFLVPFLAWLAVRVMPSFYEACRTPGPGLGRQAATAGLVSLIVLDAAIAAAFAGPVYALAVVALMPVASRLAEAVT